MSNLPTDAAARKNVPIFSGLLMYFPDACAAVAACSKVGNDQHSPGKPLHWDRSKSNDHGDALLRHQMEVGTIDTDQVRHATKVAWRALAQLQVELENERKISVDPGPRPVRGPRPLSATEGAGLHPSDASMYVPTGLVLSR